MYMKDPMGIELKSMEIIEEDLGRTSFSLKEKVIVKRMIHTTGDFDYKDIVVFQEDFVNIALDTIKSRGVFFADTKMATMGINKKALERASWEVRCFIDDEDVFRGARERQTTRSACAVEKAVDEGIDAFIIGNAPTALFRLLELVGEKKVKPRFIIGVPVGFVGAAESKAYLREFPIPAISTLGNKGGSNVAASVVNALLYMAVGR